MNSRKTIFFYEKIFLVGRIGHIGRKVGLIEPTGGCIQCHMPEGDHSWSMTTSDGTEKIETCVQEGCHVNGTITSFDRTARSDFDGDGTVEGVQTEDEGLLEQLRELLPKKEDGTLYSSGFNNAGLTVLEFQAYWNYYVINNEGSKGIQNT